MRLVLAARFLVRLTDINTDAPTDLAVAYRVPGLVAARGKIFRSLASQFKWRQCRQHHVGVFLFGYPLHGFRAAGAGNPNRRMGFLVGPGPHIDVAEPIVLAVPAERAVSGPALDNQIVRFVKSIASVGRIYFIRKV